MNILVTGAAGFIGSALCKKLSEEGHTVIGIDNYNDYYDVQLKHDRVAALIPDIKLVEGDFGDAELLTKLFSEHSFDVVCHLAGLAGVRYSAEYPQKYIDNNVIKFVSLLEVMKNNDCRRVVFASSSSVYGNDTDAPFSEDSAASSPESVYAATKRTGELLLHSYFSQYGIQSTALRFFTVYGPWSRPDMMMLKFALKIEAGESIPVYNKGDLRRDFTYIDDIVNGFILSVEKPLGCEIINLGGGRPVQLLDIISTIENSLQKQTQHELLPMQVGDVYETYADTTKAKDLIGFEAKVDLTAGIERFVDWFNEYYTDIAVS